MPQGTRGSGGEDVLPGPAVAPNGTLGLLLGMFKPPYVTTITPEGKRNFQLVTGAGDVVLLEGVSTPIGEMRLLKNVAALNTMIQDEERIVPTDMRVGLRTLYLNPPSSGVRLYSYAGKVVIRLERRSLSIRVIGLHKPRVYNPALACGARTIIGVADSGE